MKKQTKTKKETEITTINMAWDEGWKAYWEEKGNDACPDYTHQELKDEWMEGWLDAKASDEWIEAGLPETEY